MYSKYLIEKLTSATILKQQILSDFEKYWRYQNDVSYEEWVQFSKYILESNASIRSVGWVDETNTLRWRNPYNKEFVEDTNRNLQRDILDIAQQKKEIIATPYKKQRSGFYGYALVAPLYRKDTFKGYYYITLDAYDFLRDVVKNDRFSVTIFGNNMEMYSSNSDRVGVPEFSYKENFELQGKNTLIKVAPSRELVATLDLLSDEIVIILSLFISILVAGLYYFLMESRDRQKIITNQVTLLANSSKLMALGEMASGIAHEINNPLAILSGKIHTLKKELGPQATESLIQHLERMDQIIFRIAKIISSLKKLSYKANESQHEVVSLKSIFVEVLGLYKEKIKNSGVDLQIDSIPEVMIQCNPIEVNQILSNLLSNAYDAVSSLQEKWIRVSFNIVNENIRIQVVDSGSGIPEQIQSKILQPFFTTKPVGMGMGIGLSISHSLAKHNQGDLYLDNKCKNTKFVLELKASTSHSEVGFV